MNDIPKTWGEFLTLGESMRNAQKEYLKNHKAWNSSEYLECSKELEKKFDDAIKYIRNKPVDNGQGELFE